MVEDAINVEEYEERVRDFKIKQQPILIALQMMFYVMFIICAIKFLLI